VYIEILGNYVNIYNCRCQQSCLGWKDWSETTGQLLRRGGMVNKIQKKKENYFGKVASFLFFYAIPLAPEQTDESRI